ncbi:MAG: hypothetical protein IJV31_05730 [Clostridia bacterium]|nr:hypothetical protein [Clostridia bacterium]
MNFENEKYKPENHSPIVDVDGVIEKGKQFDIEITLPEDNRNVIYGVIKNRYKEPVSDAVVKLIEVDYKMGKAERKPVSHTFTDKEGEFVFGPLCPEKKYELQIWVNEVKHVKVCAKCFHEGKCLKGQKLDKCDFDMKPYVEEDYHYNCDNVEDRIDNEDEQDK